MRKCLAVILSVLFLVSCAFSVAFALGSRISIKSLLATNDSSEGTMKTLGKERVFTRNGPDTDYRDTGTYNVEGGEVRVYSYAYDRSGDCWVQCDFTYKNQLRRLYTRLEEIDEDCFDLTGVPLEEPLDYEAKVVSVSKLYYGPSDEYDDYGNSFKSKKGAIVYITAIEGDYAQVQWTTSKQSYRVWVPLKILKY